MASPGGGTSSGSSSLQQNSGFDKDLHTQMMHERKWKRMQSNRESARRSRMRKQKHLDDLMVEVSLLRKANNQLVNNINVSTQQYFKVEAANSILSAQVSELSSRLQSLNEISNVLSAQNHNLGVYEDGDNSFLMNTWNSTPSLNQPIIASANMFHY